MKYWVVMMYTEIGCFVVCISGWILVCSTMPTEYWNFSTVEGIVLTTANYFSNLWKDCISDSTGMSDCKEFPSLLGLESKSDCFPSLLQHERTALKPKIYFLSINFHILDIQITLDIRLLGSRCIVYPDYLFHNTVS